MEWYIIVNSKKIAAFENEQDRDICFDALAEYWGKDVTFLKEDDAS